MKRKLRNAALGALALFVGGCSYQAGSGIRSADPGHPMHLVLAASNSQATAGIILDCSNEVVIYILGGSAAAVPVGQLAPDAPVRVHFAQICAQANGGN